MPRFKKSKPLAVCTVCHAYTDATAYVNSRCHTVVLGRRCSGVFKNTLGQVWAECQGCKAYGTVGSVACGECKGFGWKLS